MTKEKKEKEKEWIPAFAGMTKKKKKKEEEEEEEEEEKEEEKTWARRPCYVVAT